MKNKISGETTKFTLIEQSKAKDFLLKWCYDATINGFGGSSQNIDFRITHLRDINDCVYITGKSNNYSGITNCNIYNNSFINKDYVYFDGVSEIRIHGCPPNGVLHTKFRITIGEEMQRLIKLEMI